MEILCRLKPGHPPVEISSSTTKIYKKSFKLPKTLICSQTQFYDSLHHFGQSILHGINGCIFFFGPTRYFLFSSGKSFTMLGTQSQNRGIVPRVVQDLLQNKKLGFDLLMSIFQVYQDKKLDLLANKLLQRREPLYQYKVNTISDYYSIFYHAMTNRKISFQAKKSHLILQISVFQGQILVGELAFIELVAVDLASADTAVQKTHGVSTVQRKSIAKTFNAISAVLTKGVKYAKESLLTSCLQKLLDLKNHYQPSKVLFVCNLCNKKKKHNIAALKFSQRLAQADMDLEQETLRKVSKLKHEISLVRNPSLPWIQQQIQEVDVLNNQINQINSQGAILVNTERLHNDCQSIRRHLFSIDSLRSTPKRKSKSSSLLPRRKRIKKVRKTPGFGSHSFKMTGRKSPIFGGFSSSFNSNIPNSSVRGSPLHSERIIRKTPLLQSNSPQKTDISPYNSQFDINPNSNFQQNSEILQMLKRENTIQQGIIIRQNRQIECLQNQKQKFSQKLAESQTQQIKLKDIALRASPNPIQSELSKKNEQIFQLQQIISKLQKELEQSKKQLQNQKQRSILIQQQSLSSYQAKIGALKESKIQSKQKLKSQKVQTGKLLQTLQALQKQAALQLQKNQNLQQQLKNKHAQLVSCHQSYTREKKQLRRQNKSLRSQFQKPAFMSINSQAPLDYQLEYKQKKIERLKREKLILSDQIAALSKRYQEDIKQVCQQRDEAFEAVQQIKISHIQHLGLLEQQINSVEKQMEESQIENVGLVAKQQDLLRQLRKAQSQRTEYKETARELRRDLDKLEMQFQQTGIWIQDILQEKQGFKIGDSSDVVDTRLKALSEIRSKIQGYRLF